MHMILLALLILAPAPTDVSTIEECLLRSGFSTEVLDNAELVGMVGTDLHGDAIVAPLGGQRLVIKNVDTDTGLRKVALYAYAGNLYAFVYKHEQDPQAFGISEDGYKAHHGDCMKLLHSFPSGP